MGIGDLADDSTVPRRRDSSDLFAHSPRPSSMSPSPAAATASCTPSGSVEEIPVLLMWGIVSGGATSSVLELVTGFYGYKASFLKFVHPNFLAGCCCCCCGCCVSGVGSRKRCCSQCNSLLIVAWIELTHVCSASCAHDYPHHTLDP